MSLLHQQNMKYKLVIFDFDGTIADTSLGILDSHRYTMSKMGREVPSDAVLFGVIGGNLLKTYVDVFGLDETIGKIAVQIYRNRYAENGIHMVKMYQGFTELLYKLKEHGCYIGVATLKSERFAKIMLDDMAIRNKFDIICGMDENDQLTKADLVERCISYCGVDKKDAVLIGDSNNDYLGARKAGVDFIGVTYGFGFDDEKKYKFQTVKDPLSIYKILLVH